MTDQQAAGIDRRIVKALSHPLRQRILDILSRGVASPVEVAKQLDTPLGSIAYHVQILLANDCLELVETRPVRGAVQHFYRATARPFFDDAHWAQLPAHTRRALFGQTLEQIGEHVLRAAGAGGFDRKDAHVTWTLLQLDEEGWTDLSATLVAVLDDVARIQAESLARLARTGADPLRSELAMLHFERDGDPAG